MDKEIIKIAKKYHNLYWDDSNDNRSTGNSTTKLIHNLWQQECEQIEGVQSEYEVTDEHSQSLDIYNIKTRTAFELKVSGKNIKHEVYKDICKVVTNNIYRPYEKIEKFYFISDRKAIESLERTFSKRLKKSFKDTYGFEIKFEPIDSK